MPDLFETTTIKSLELANRFMRSATWLGMVNENGSCSSDLIDVMTELARGGVGLIMADHAYISKVGQVGP